MLNKVFSMLVIILAYAQTARSQQDFSYLKPKRVVPPSPEVAALFKFTELPVTLYSGLPGISIPITEFKLKEYSLPIALQYHAGGIKVDEVATNVGIGWALNAGGCLTITERGASDISGGYPGASEPIDPAIVGSVPASPPEYNPGNPSDARYRWYQRAADRVFDTEPDLFDFTAGGFSGKFFYDQRGYVHSIPLRKIKVSELFRIADEKGVAHYFTKPETSSSDIGPGNNSYLLTKIVTPDKDSILLSYEAVNYSYKAYLGESRYKFLSGVNDIQLLGAAGAVMDHTPYGNITVNGWRIKEITATNGMTVKFVYAATERTDLPGTNALTSIEIYYDNVFYKKFKLVQEYVGNLTFSDGHRLRLMEVYEEAADGSRIPPYVFTYNDAVALPPRLSCYQDHWGYSKSTTGYLSSRLPIHAKYFTSGLDRSVDTTYSKAGMLTQIKYPTGGASIFNFEPNEVWLNSEPVESVLTGGAGIGGIPDVQTQTTFTVPEGTLYDMKVFYNSFNQPYAPGGPIPDPPVEEEPSCNIYLIKPGNVVVDYTGRNSNPDGDPISLPPGQYTIMVQATGTNYNSFWQFSYKKDTVTYYTGKRFVGGWRVKDITTKDPFHPDKDKFTRYDYALDDNQPERSSGITPSPMPAYEYQRDLAKYKKTCYTNTAGTEVCEVEYFECRILMQSSNSVLALYNGQGAIFYPRVSVYEGLNGANGKSVHYFSYHSDEGGDFGFPATSRGSFDWYNGLLLKREDYRKEPGGGYTLISDMRNVYSIASDETYWQQFYQENAPGEIFRGIGMQVSYLVREESSGLLIWTAKFNVGLYRHISKWYHLDSTVTTQYPDAGTPLQIASSFYYENPVHIQQTKSITINSKGQELRFHNTYPEDYPGVAVYDAMKSRNMINYTVEQKKIKNSTLEKQARINYQFWQGNSLILPGVVESSVVPNLWETELTYNLYDPKGNVLQYTGRDGITHTFLWGYNSRFPVAEVTGSDYASVSGLVNNSILQAPSSDANLRSELSNVRTGLANEKAQVNSFTYKPLYGLSSAIDVQGKLSFYEYDVFGRLKLIKDQNGKILKQYDYQYQVPITQ